MKYRVYLEPDEDGVFVATCPALPGCISQGRTRAEATANIREAIDGSYTERQGLVRIINVLSPRQESQDSMNPSHPEENDDILPEHDFGNAVRGKHHQAHKAGTNVVFLDPDVAKVFKDSESVNRALRLLLNLAQETATPKPGP